MRKTNNLSGIPCICGIVGSLVYTTDAEVAK